MRARGGIGPVVVDPGAGDHFQLADRVRGEYVLQVTGRVRARDAATVNPNMATGEVEVYGTGLTILSEVETTPFLLYSHVSVGEDVSLYFCYLDLLRPDMLTGIRYRFTV